MTREEHEQRVKLWTDALEHGGYSQGTGWLKQQEVGGGEKFCCLGVACMVYRDQGLVLRMEPGSRYNGTTPFRFGEDNSTGALPGAVRRWFGLQEESGEFWNKDKTSNSLALLNDGGAGFADIAATIKARPEGLFDESLIDDE